MFERMKTIQVVYVARCKDCNDTYGFITPAERDSYLTTWHTKHDVSRSTEALA